MKPDEYLEKILKEQGLSDSSTELAELRKHRKDVEEVIKKHFSGSNPTIRYGGSKAKGTMIREAYDLDVICYFPHDEEEAGKNLKEIYDNTKEALEEKYFVEPKTSALRLKEKSESLRQDFHIDVVPGRFTDKEKSDVYIHQENADKSRLKTNLDKHIEHIRDRGVKDAIKLLKLWKERNYLRVKTFLLELLAVKLLSNKKSNTLSEQLMHVWTEFQDNAENLSIEDPANPNGNDLKPMLDEIRYELSSVATNTLAIIGNSGWEGVFGDLQEEGEDEEDKAAALGGIAVHVSKPTKPWHPGS